MWWKRHHEAPELSGFAPAGQSRTFLRAPYFVGNKRPKSLASSLLNVAALLLLIAALAGTVARSLGATISLPWEAKIARLIGIPQTPALAGPTAAQQKDIVLVVESDPELRRVALTTLSRHGFTVLLASTGTEAFQVFGRAANDVGLVILGSSPDVTRTRDAMRRVRPDVKILVSKVPGTLTFAGLGSGILPRPYTAGQLAEAVHKVVGWPNGAGR